MGIPEEIINNLYDPFVSSKKTSYGIGLSVTHRLIKENRGKISITSEKDMGTTAIIELPRKDITKEDENA